ncbi:MbcA/ParS/Xre antitoxin family protein [Muricoccus aerilatus]|uniref:MbcA/ParS/Xre antitoxin family protein n=1 Tax=Muricoccus aerilatus TaxID=452982 RepID=UPI0005C23050|nr:antitoxin Xre/MbcA/ParS toxin-binding domain-containing protein [Roseomonas aerilata]
MGFWVHGQQQGMDAQAWGEMFFARRRAILREGATRRFPKEPHPFSGAADGLRARLAALPQARAQELFKEALYSWLLFHSSGEWHSLAQAWGFGMGETLALLGQPTPEQVKVWATYPRPGGATLLPFSLPLLERLGLLFGLNALLLWGLRDPRSRAAWLRTTNARLDGSSPLDLLLGGEIEGVRRVLEAARAGMDDGGERR